MYRTMGQARDAQEVEELIGKMNMG